MAKRKVENTEQSPEVGVAEVGIAEVKVPGVDTDERLQKMAKILEEDILKARQELQDGFRDVFVERDNEKVKIRLIRATKEIEDAAENVRAGFYFRILSKNSEVPTESQVLEALTARGIWGEDEENRIEDIQQRLAKIRNTVYRYQKNTGGKDARAFAKEIDKLEKEREELVAEKAKLDKKRESFMSGTAERLAGEARRQFVMRHCILGEDEKPFWADEDAWISAAQAESDFWAEATVQLQLFWAGLPGTLEGTLDTFYEGSPEIGPSE